MASDDRFYIGYLPEMDSEQARQLKLPVLGALVLVALLALVLAGFQSPFAASAFEFGSYRSFEGTILETPYPMIRLERPQPLLATAQAQPAQSRNSLYYLVHFGKQGAEKDVKGLHGKRVKLEGALIYRDDQTMLELRDSGHLEVLGEGQLEAQQLQGEVELVGEIVDSKCFFGVMNPGNLATHKACAIRCISGGIPPVLLVRLPAGDARYFLLTDAAGGMLNQRILDKIAVPVRVKGLLSVLDNLFVIKTDPEAIQLLP